MKDKLEPNMYVRTKDGKIAKFIKYDEEDKEELVTDYYEYSTIWIKDVAKASYNIIDLIEVGDYVNGVEVINIDDEWITMSDMQVPILKSIANGLIKSVVTHEQMEQVAYKVGE